jgi:hypothetical protein
MADQLTPYIDRKPGDLITAEDWDDMQKKIKGDIANQIKAAKDDVLHGVTPVDHAVNSDQFDHKTPQNWTDDLDQRYALRVHDHEGAANYQRYFLELESIQAGGSELPPALLVHGMGRNPVAQIYQLNDLPFADDKGTPITLTPPKCMAFCGPEHVADPEAIQFVTKSWDERHWGDPIDVVKDGLGRYLNAQDQKAFLALFPDHFTLNTWLTNLERQLFEPGPGQFHFDVGSIYRTKWVRDRLSSKISQLKDEGEWPPRFVYRPLLLDTSGLEVPAGGNGTPPLRVDVYHLSLNEIELQAHTVATARLMVLLRA